VGEFLELLPALLTPQTYLEVVHSILDLPCLSAALQQKHARTLDAPAGTANPAITGALHNYIFRSEGGLGGTIDRLNELHRLFASQVSHVRVQTAAQVSPLLLRRFFQLTLAHIPASEYSHLGPVVLERVGSLFPMPAFAAAIRVVRGSWTKIVLCHLSLRLIGQICAGLVGKHPVAL
jgi:AP-5 complex subunit zeta-1